MIFSRFLLLPGLGWLILLAAQTAVSAPQTPVQLTVTASQPTLTVGDPVQITLDVQHPPTHQVTLNEPAWGIAETLTVEPPQPTEHGTRFGWQITLWQPGTHTLPPLAVTIVDDAGNAETAVASPLILTVRSVLPATDRTLRDIRPQATLPRPTFRWGWLLGVAALVGGTAVWLRRRRNIPVHSASPPTTAPSAILQELDAIATHPLPPLPELATRLFHLLRTCLQRRYVLPRQTTATELGQAVLSLETLPEALRHQLQETLMRLDVARFAPATVDQPAAEPLLAQVRALVAQVEQRPPR